MPRTPKKPAQVRQPGGAVPPANEQTDAATGAQPEPATQPSDDAAIAAGRAGGTHKVVKPRSPVAPSKIQGDPERPADAPVNQDREMPYDEAMKRLQDRQDLDALKALGNPNDADRKRMAELEKTALRRNVLTDQGWVVVPGRLPPART